MKSQETQYRSTPAQRPDSTIFNRGRSLLVSLLVVVTATLTGQENTNFFKAAGTPANPKVTISWNRYNTYDGIVDICQRLTKAYPDLIKMESAGKSYQGRDMIVLTITNFRNGKPENKPGYYIDGNIHSNEIQGTEMALYAAWYLTEMFDENDFIRELMDDRVFYIFPTINPDAREDYIRNPNTASSPRSGMAPRDDDRDGLFDEDGFEDINGDGSITTMRRKNPNGRYRTDPADPRQMIPVQEGEQGEYEILGMEGIDNDGDGLVNEDRQGSYDPNRDWGYSWQPNYIQGGADKYPFTFPENRSVRDFALKHPNIAGVQSYHNSGGMILRGPSMEGGGSEVFTREDDNVLNTIGKVGEKMIPGYRLLVIWKDLYTVYGGELDWWYGATGAYTYSNELWTGFLMFNDPQNNNRNEFEKLLLHGDTFTPWEEFDHPVYGKVEIGGYQKNFGRLHPGFLLESDAHRNTAFALYHASQLPKLAVRDIEVKNLGGGLNEVTATVTNSRITPTHSGQNLKYRIDPPNYISIEGGEVITGMIVEDRWMNVTAEQKKNPATIEVDNISGNSEVIVRWIVKGGNKYTVKVKSVKGGVAELTKTE